MNGRQSVIYAHVAREPGVRGLAVQYWFYYWFNQFNDLHESDWEMIQVAFDAATPEEALERGPAQLAYAQHEGGERRSWDDPRVEKEGTHPVVYVSSGSHASQYWSALFLGNGRSGSGLGCDDTRGPSTAHSAHADPRDDLPDLRVPRRLAHLSRPLGPARARGLERADGPEHEAPVAGAVPLDERLAHLDAGCAHERGVRRPGHRRRSAEPSARRRAS